METGFTFIQDHFHVTVTEMYRQDETKSYKFQAS